MIIKYFYYIKKSISKSILILSVLLLAHSTSHANWIRDRMVESCEKNQSTTIDLVKHILQIYYNINNKIKVGDITKEQGEKFWKEEVEKFQDFLYEVAQKIDKETWSTANPETRRILKMQRELHNAAIFLTVPEFFGSVSMPPDTRIARIYTQKCHGAALGLN
jgi:hypothetical protein